MGRETEQTFLQKGHTDSQYEKVLNVINQGNTNQNYNDIPPHTCQNGYHEWINKQQVLARMWRKGYPSALLVGMQIGAAAESSMEFPQKIMNRVAIQSSNSTSG